VTRAEAALVARRVRAWRYVLGLPALSVAGEADAERVRARRERIGSERTREEWRLAQRARRERLRAARSA
jgi:hypothetical protein